MLIGVSLAFGAAVLFALGNILEKHAVNGMRAFALRNLRQSIGQVLRSTGWMAGAIASVVGSFVQVLAYRFAAISIVQSVGVAGVVIVVIVSKLHFREEIRRMELSGLWVCILAFLLTMISIHGGGTVPGERGAYLPVMIATVITAVFAALLMAVRARSGDFAYGVASGLMYGIVGLSSKGLSTALKSHSVGNVVTSLVTSPYLYVMALSWLLALLIFQAGLQIGRVGVIGPLSGAVSAIYVTAVGTPLFGEHLPGSSFALVLRILGFAGVLLGSSMLAIGGARIVSEFGVHE